MDVSDKRRASVGRKMDRCALPRRMYGPLSLERPGHARREINVHNGETCRRPTRERELDLWGCWDKELSIGSPSHARTQRCPLHGIGALVSYILPVLGDAGWMFKIRTAGE
ncbi:hypothetical protein D8B26_005851 [Coccidioides posadasii str. Silveira]|uniref:uncharacterized protein n=1 Tax=Coccidioides posadasii (strain RMSCC 757 / Silveira) TaxID=443226 RepID=UPI001BEDEE0E|nr:hypothetical protein D8B26_005851 [Coccidioides posadasii str. Silveira]